jgi:hypothetical protein
LMHRRCAKLALDGAAQAIEEGQVYLEGFD